MFAFACPLSVMISPVVWTHYQIVLAPLFVLLLVRFAGEDARVGAWMALGAAFVLASLMWEPYGTSIGTIIGLLGAHTDSFTRSWHYSTIAFVAQFAQYVLLITGLCWYTRSQPREVTRTLYRLG
jgi:hypothetical protein